MSPDKWQEVGQALAGSSVDCVKIIGLDGKLLLLNPGGHEILEVQDPKVLEDLEWINVWPGEHRTAAKLALEAAARGDVGRFQAFAHTFSGAGRWWDVVVSPLRGPDGSVDRFLSVSRDITDLKEAQKSQLREREILEQLAADNSVDRCLESICDLILSEAPPLSASIVSWDPDERLATGRTSLVKGFSQPLTVDEIVMALPPLAGESWVGLRQRFEELHLHCCDVAILTDRASQPCGLLLLHCKISESCAISRASRASWVGLSRLALQRDRALRTLQKSQNRFLAISKVSPIGIYHADYSGACTFVNPRWSAITGLTENEGLGLGWIKALHPEDRDAVLAAWGQAVATSTDFRAEYRLQDQQGRITWVIGQATATEGHGFVGTMTDVSDLKRAHLELSETLARFELLANNMSQLCWIADELGSAIWYNQRWYDYTGTTFEQMKGWGWTSVHHPDHIDRVVERISRCWQTGEDWEDTFPLRGKSGEYRWFLSRAKPIRNAAGNLERWFGTNTDVTEQRGLEESLATQNQALRRSNAELTQFAYVASHDLQEPLRTIANYTQLLERRHSASLNEDAKRSLAVIIDSSHRMSKLITDLLEYSRISSETIDPLQTVELETAVQDAKVMLSVPLREAGAELIVGKLPSVRGARSRLSQLFLNLIGNSIKYRRADVPLRIRIDCEPAGAFWRVTVNDNGQGFAPEYAERIFGIFKRLHGREIPGTGIGLALCRSIVEQMGGTIGAEGGVDNGSTFWFTVPR